MLKITNKTVVSIWAFVYTLLIILLGLIIFLSITGPQNNLFPWQMAIGTVLGTVLFLCFFLLWDRIPYERLKQSAWLYVTLLILYGALLYAISCISRNSPYSLDDYMQIWYGAWESCQKTPRWNGSDTEFLFSLCLYVLCQSGRMYRHFIQTA